MNTTTTTAEEQDSPIITPDLEIREDFRDLIPPLSPAEYDQLECDIRTKERALAPIIVWKKKNIILDGHNRYEICKRHGLEFTVYEQGCSSENAARNAVILYQLGRRNVAPDVASMLRGKLYDGRKQDTPNPKGIGGKSGKAANIVMYQNDTQQKDSTREQVAKATGVSPATIMRDAKFAQACDVLGISAADLASGDEKRPKKQIIAEAKAVTEKSDPPKPKAPPKPQKPKWQKMWQSFKRLEHAEQVAFVTHLENHWTESAGVVEASK